MLHWSNEVRQCTDHIQQQQSNVSCSISYTHTYTYMTTLIQCYWLLTECCTEAMKYDSAPTTFNSSSATYPAALVIHTHIHSVWRLISSDNHIGLACSFSWAVAIGTSDSNSRHTAPPINVFDIWHLTFSVRCPLWSVVHWHVTAPYVLSYYY